MRWKQPSQTQQTFRDSSGRKLSQKPNWNTGEAQETKAERLVVPFYYGLHWCMLQGSLSGTLREQQWPLYHIMYHLKGKELTVKRDHLRMGQPEQSGSSAWGREPAFCWGEGLVLFWHHHQNPITGECLCVRLLWNSQMRNTLEHTAAISVKNTTVTAERDFQDWSGTIFVNSKCPSKEVNAEEEETELWNDDKILPSVGTLCKKIHIHSMFILLVYSERWCIRMPKQERSFRRQLSFFAACFFLLRVLKVFISPTPPQAWYVAT